MDKDYEDVLRGGIIAVATILAMLVVVFMLSGCAGLNVSWNASYNMPQIANQVNPALPALPSLPPLQFNPPLLSPNLSIPSAK